MDEMSILKKLETVKAPPGFEQSVMAALSLRQRGERRRRSALRLSLAGSFAALLGAFVLFNVLVPRQKLPVVSTAMRGVGAPAGRISPGAVERRIPVIETFDYASEIRSRSPDPQAVYLLEQVSDTTSKGITY
jgi:hypothetical protein